MVICNQCAGSGTIYGRTETGDKSNGKSKNAHAGSGAVVTTGCQQCQGKGYILTGSGA